MGIPRLFTRLPKRAALAAGLLLLGLAAACAGSGDDDSSAGSLVPQRANLVGTIATNQTLDALNLGSDQLSGLFSSAALGEVDGLAGLFNIDQFESGGLFGNVSRAEIFAEVSESDDPEYFAALLHGSFDEAPLIAALESASGTGLAQVVYKGSNVYSSADGDDEFELSILDGSVFAFGIGNSIRDIIDIRAGDADPASGPLMDRFNELDDGLFGLVLKVPQGIAEQADLGSVPGFGDLPISLDFISTLDNVGLEADLNGGSLDLVVTMDFTDQESAESLENFIGGIVTLSSGFLTDPNTAGLLEGLKVDRDGSLLTLEIGIPVADIPDLFSDLGYFTGIGSSSSSSTFGYDDTSEIRVLKAAIGEKVPVLVDINHVPEGQKVDYQDAPPSSGQHWSTPAGCGFYTESLPDERIVHNMEHGNVVVSYNFTNPAQTTELRQALDDVDLFEDWGVARPYDRIADGQVALTAWGRVHTMTGVNPGEIERFFEAFSGELGPEQFTC